MKPPLSFRWEATARSMLPAFDPKNLYHLERLSSSSDVLSVLDGKDSNVGKYKHKSRLVSSKTNGEGEEEECLDLFIHSILQNCLANIETSPDIRARILRHFEIDDLPLFNSKELNNVAK